MRKFALAGACWILIVGVASFAAPATRPSSSEKSGRNKPAAAAPAGRPTSKPADRPADHKSDQRADAASPATAPAGAPATQPTSNPANPASRVILAGVIEYIPPDGWVVSKGSKKPTTDVYVSPREDGVIAIELLPPEADAYGGMSAKIIQHLRQVRQTKKQKFVMEPKVEQDKRFVLRIRERYMVQDHGEREAEQLHLYRQVGPRLVMVTINAVSDESDRVKLIQAAGEDAALSATFIKPAKPPTGAKGK